MKQKKYGLTESIRRLSNKNRSFLSLIIFDCSTAACLLTLKKIVEAKRHIQMLRRRTKQITSVTFNLNVYSDLQALRDFRFRVHEIGRVAQLMHCETYSTKTNRYKTNPVLSCAIVLRRLSSPTRWLDLELVFGKSGSALNEIFWETIDFFIQKEGHLLAFRPGLISSRAPQYARAVYEKGAPLDMVVGFIDCTKIQMSRPKGHGSFQRASFSGHKRFHCLIYQTVTTPDGLIFHLYGPEVGRRHDMYLYRTSGLDGILRDTLLIEGKQYAIYGDAAYLHRPWLQVAFSRFNVTPQQTLYNQRMSAVREAVEWSYKDIKQLWSSQDYKRNLKVRKAPISQMYKAAAILTNIKTCLHKGGQVGSYFGVEPPSIDEYMTSN